MNEDTRKQIRQLLPALQALEKSVRRALQENTYAGTSAMAVKSYHGLHARAAQLLPDDVYITHSLALEISADADEREKVAQVQLAASQLVHYLESQARGIDLTGDFEDLRDISRSLRDRILAQTKDTIRRAMADVEINIEGDWGDWGRRSRRRKKKITITSDDDNYIGADFSGQNLQSRDFSDQDMTEANLSGAQLHEANFTDATLVQANLSGAQMPQANLEDADLTAANLSGANLQDANLEDAVLVQANLGGANLRDANLEDADLSGANLSGANLQDANLSDAHLPHANLSGANLRSANLRDADLSEADLRSANLQDANLRDAHLHGANLRGATLRDANLRDARLEGAVLPDGGPYRPGDDLARFGVQRGPGRRIMDAPPVPPVPPAPPAPPWHPTGDDDEPQS